MTRRGLRKSKIAESLNLAQKEVLSQSDVIDKLIRAKGNSSPRRQTDNPKDKFDATDKDRQLKYMNWRSTMLRNITIDAEYFDTPHNHILYIGSQLDGDGL